MSDPPQLRPVGLVQSPLRDLAEAPLQAHEGAPAAWLVFDDAVAEALDGTPIIDVKAVLGAEDR